MQSALQDCITSLQHVYVQRDAIINAKTQMSLEGELLRQGETLPKVDSQTSSDGRIDKDLKESNRRVLDEAFAASHSQLLSSIATLQKRLIVIQTGLASSPAVTETSSVGRSPSTRVPVSLFTSPGQHSPLLTPHSISLPSPRVQFNPQKLNQLLQQLKSSTSRPASQANLAGPFSARPLAQQLFDGMT